MRVPPVDYMMANPHHLDIHELRQLMMAHQPNLHACDAAEEESYLEYEPDTNQLSEIDECEFFDRYED